MVLFLNGSINSGKSTVARILAQQMSRTALLEIDALDDCIQRLPLSESNPINLENAVLLIRNFHRHRFNVVVPYPISKPDWAFIQQELSDIPLYVFLLRPSLSVAVSNRGRMLTQREVERVRQQYTEGTIMDVGSPIDNSAQRPEDTAHLVLRRLREEMRRQAGT